MAEYKQVDLQIGTEAQFESKKETLSVGTIVGITDPINKTDLDSDLLTSIDSIDDKLDKPAGNPTEDSFVKVSSTGSTSYQSLSTLVDVSSNQVVTGQKTFNNLYVNFLTASTYLRVGNSTTDRLQITKDALIRYGTDGLFQKNTIPFIGQYEYNLALAPTTAPAQPSIIVTGTDRVPTWKPLSELADSTDLNSKLNKPNNPTEDSVVTLTNTGTVGTTKLSDLASAVTAATMKYTAVTIPWANVAANGFTDTVRQVGSIYEHSLYIRLTYEDWNAEVFLTVISTESSQITSSSALSTLLGSTYYHEASGTIHQTVDSTNFYLGQIQNVSHNGVKVLIPV